MGPHWAHDRNFYNLLAPKVTEIIYGFQYWRRWGQPSPRASPCAPIPSSRALRAPSGSATPSSTHLQRLRPPALLPGVCCQAPYPARLLRPWRQRSRGRSAACSCSCSCPLWPCPAPALPRRPCTMAPRACACTFRRALQRRWCWCATAAPLAAALARRAWWPWSGPPRWPGARGCRFFRCPPPPLLPARCWTAPPARAPWRCCPATRGSRSRWPWRPRWGCWAAAAP
jgi:hypothetical protein